MACLSSSVSASSLAVLSVVPFWVFCAAPYLDAVDTAVPENKYTQEADSPKCSTPMPKVVIGVPRVLKVFAWVFLYKFHKKIGLGQKKSQEMLAGKIASTDI